MRLELYFEQLSHKNNLFYLRVKVTEDSRAQFADGADGKNYTNVGDSFTARNGKWVGARVGVFAVRIGKHAKRATPISIGSELNKYFLLRKITSAIQNSIACYLPIDYNASGSSRRNRLKVSTL